MTYRALRRLVELHDETPRMLTSDDWQYARDILAAHDAHMNILKTIFMWLICILSWFALCSLMWWAVLKMLNS